MKAILGEVKEGLAKSKISFDEKIEIGTMIEVPSASITADILAREVDFFSIGTNDLIQYVLALDRINEHVSYLYEPLHPAILRIIKGVVQGAQQHGVPVAVCGEMAAEPACVMILMGLGLREFSMNPASIPKMKKMLRRARVEDTRSLVEEVFQYSTASEIESHVRKWMTKRFPEEYALDYEKELKA